MAEKKLDLIDRRALGIGRCNPDVFLAENSGYCAGWNGVINIIEEAPTVDAVEVVRCRECAVPHNKYTGCPKLNGLITPPDFYCKHGERRTNG